MKIAFITNLCAHYRVRTFETLARYHDLDYYFFSAGDEWYWQRQHGVQTGAFNHQYLRGLRVGRTRWVPTLPLKLWRSRYDLYIKCINGKFALPVTYLVARLRRKPFILWTGIWMRLDSPLHRLFFPLTRYIYRHADAVVVYGEHVKAYLIGEGVSPQRIFIAAHAVDNDQYNRVVSEAEKDALRHVLQIGPDQPVALYLGRLEEGKGLDYLLEAFAAVGHESAVLVLAGEGAQRAALEQRAADLGIAARVRFAGYIPAEQTTPYYALASVYLLPSVTTRLLKETWGLVVNEAFNQGVPVIATTAVGAAAGGLVQDGINGLVVPERSTAALARALQSLLDDPDLRTRLGENARRLIATWDNERMVAGFREAIEAVQHGS